MPNLHKTNRSLRKRIKVTGTGKVLVRMAVNQEMAQPTAPVKAGDEIAFFPPVTGG